MRFHPTRIHWSLPLFCCIASFVLILGCSKDPDILSEAKFVESQEEVVQSEQGSQGEDTADAPDEDNTEASGDDATTSEEETEDTSDEGLQEEGASGIEEDFETRLTSFPPTQDAYLQSGKGINENLIRLEEGNRTSYLMFDLSPIGEIGGYITDAKLRFTVTTDGGDGEIAVYKGLDTNWNETELDFDNAPDSDILLGSINDTYVAGSTQEIVLSSADMVPERTTLILFHANGNDLALASKEHPSKAWPKLVVSYNAPQDAKEVTVEDPVTDTTSQDDTAGEEETSGDTTENQAPVAVAAATPVNGKAPLEVAFEGKDSSDDKAIQSYSWDFKDGATSTSINPTHTFTEPGTYNVSLKVTDAEGLSNVDVVTITVQEPDNQAPIASASASVTSGEAPLDVQFNADASSDDKDIVSYYWDFSTDDPSSAKNPSRTFTEAGEYVVTLTVTDAEGLKDSDTITITVTASTENQAPVARFDAAPVSGPVPLTVTFDAGASTDDSGISSYSWDFGNTETGSGANVSNTFNTVGTYTTTLTVTDTQGLQSTATVTITVEASSGGAGETGDTGGTGGGSMPEGYYVTPNGSAYANGLSESTAWSLEHAFDVAKPGDVIYVKAGTYNNPDLVNYAGGSSSSKIKFIGYRSYPGDVESFGGSTFEYGQSISASNMPLLKGASNTSGIGLDINGNDIELHNFQITNYGFGVQAKGDRILLKNVIVTNIGAQNTNNSQTGRGINIFGSGSRVEDCFILNSNGHGINIKGGSNNTIRNTKVYSDNLINMTGYYILLSNGAQNNIVENCTLYRDPSGDRTNNPHQGHGYVIKDRGSNNIIRNSIAYNTGIEVNFSGVHSNVFDNIDIRGKFSQYNTQFSSCIAVINGAHHNDFRNISISDTRYAINFMDFDDGFVGSTGDLDENEGGNDNTFSNITVDGARNILVFTSREIGLGATSNNNRFSSSTFKNISSVPFISRQTTTGTSFSNCSFQNMPSSVLKEEEAANVLPLTFSSCNFVNVGFPIP